MKIGPRCFLMAQPKRLPDGAEPYSHHLEGRAAISVLAVVLLEKEPIQLAELVLLSSSVTAMPDTPPDQHILSPHVMKPPLLPVDCSAGLVAWAPQLPAVTGFGVALQHSTKAQRHNQHT